MRAKIRTIALVALSLSCCVRFSAANADYVYTYTGNVLTVEAGTALQESAITFQFTTPNLLPADLTIASGNLAGVFSVPVTNWSTSIGPFSANEATSTATLGLAGLDFLQLSTNSSGAITGWNFFTNPITTDGSHYIDVWSTYPTTLPTIFGDTTDYVQVNPLLGFYTDAAIGTTPGSWSASSVPEIEPASAVGGLTLLFGGLAVLRGRRAKLGVTA